MLTTVAFSPSSTESRRSGSNPRERPSTTVPPRSHVGSARSISGPTWKSGPKTTIVSADVRPKSMIFVIELDSVLPWVRTAPFGWPVVPEV